jgi:hypothetical protein
VKLDRIRGAGAQQRAGNDGTQDSGHGGLLVNDSVICYVFSASRPVDTEAGQESYDPR